MRVGRFVRGMIDEDVSGSGIDTDAVFDPDRIAEALAAVVAGEPVPTVRRCPGWHEVAQRNREA